MKAANFYKDKKIVITGGGGFLGTHLMNNLVNTRNVKREKIFIPRSNQYDLREKDVCRKILKGADIVIHLAAKVGGIGYNLKNPGSMFYDNILMGAHLLEEARVSGVEKFVSIGTVCAYPKFCPVPFREQDLWNGYPEETNASYGLAKKMLLVQGQAYRDQYEFNSIFLLPVNLYGPGDNFNPEFSHVIPALIKKFIEARDKKLEEVILWGTGTPTREFLYVEDAAEGILLATELYNKREPVNLGASFEISIKELGSLIAKIVGYKGKIFFDTAMPDGQPRRKLDTSKAWKEFGFRSKTKFESGLNKTISWYEKKRKN